MIIRGEMMIPTHLSKEQGLSFSFVVHHILVYQCTRSLYLDALKHHLFFGDSMVDSL